MVDSTEKCGFQVIPILCYPARMNGVAKALLIII